MASDFVFRLDRHRRFLLGPSLALDQILQADCPASDCADRLCRAGISPLQRHPASITRATIRPSGNPASFFENANRA